MYYLDEGRRFCIGRLIDARTITALGWGWRLDPKSLWARSDNDTQQGQGRIVRLDLIGNSAVTIKDYRTTVHKRKLVLELTQGGFPTNHPPRWLALYGYLQKNGDSVVHKTYAIDRYFLRPKKVALRIAWMHGIMWRLGLTPILDPCFNIVSSQPVHSPMQHPIRNLTLLPCTDHT